MNLNSRDQAKWDSLQSAGDNAVDRILAGAASDVDIRALSKALAEQHALAGEIFDQSVQDAQLTADAYIDSLNKRRIEQGKKPLTQKAHDRLFQQSFKQVMAESLEDILVMVRQEFETHSKQVRDKVGEALEKLQRSVRPQTQPDQPQEGPTRNLFERFASYVGQRDGTPSRAPQGRSMMDRLLGRNRDPNAPRSSMLQSIKESVGSAKNKLSTFYERFRGRGGQEQSEEKAASIWIRKLKAVFDPVGNAYKKMKAGGSKLKNMLSMIGKPLLLALLNPKLIKSILAAVGEYLSFDNIKRFVSGMWDDTKKFASDAFDAAMDKVRSFFGKGKEKPKPDAKPTGVTASMPSTTTAAQAKAALPGLTTQIASAKSRVDAAQKAFDANPTAVNKKALEDAKGQLQVLNVQYTQYASKAQSASTAAIEPAIKAQQSVSAPAGGSDSPGPTTAVLAPAPAAAVAAKSSLGPVPQTEIIGDMPVYRSGRPVDWKPKEKAPVGEAGKSSAATSTIGLGSFGFDSSDPSLNILNLGMMA